MPVFSYAFIQNGERLYSFLRRNFEGKPYFDDVLFYEKNYLNVKDNEIWKLWKNETSFCSSIDKVDFVFVVPVDSSLNIKHSVQFESTWSKSAIEELLRQKVKNENISGTIDNKLFIKGKEYRILRYSSNTLPDN